MADVRIVLASHNTGKLREARDICRESGLEIVGAGELGLELGQETIGGYETNAFIKARSVASPGVIAIGEDSGLEVEALDGRPGPLSARYGGDVEQSRRNELLLGELSGEERRQARFVAVCAVVFPDGRTFTGRGECRGVIALRPSGKMGFGYDPIFIPEGSDRTMAELGSEEKNGISHRKMALRLAISAVESWMRGVDDVAIDRLHQ